MTALSPAPAASFQSGIVKQQIYNLFYPGYLFDYRRISLINTDESVTPDFSSSSHFRRLLLNASAAILCSDERCLFLELIASRRSPF
jgi:hypothetical protein